MSEFDLEAEEFDRRIQDRVSSGFVPDLRKMRENDYFYKSFWRHPHYVDLHVGEMFRHYLKYLGQYCQSGARVLDLGCGPGYFALELARNGYDVVGVDVSRETIAAAKEAQAANTEVDGFGSLQYFAMSFEKIHRLGEFDAVLSSGFLHHIPSIDQAVNAASDVLKPEGILVWHEPTHARWSRTDAAFVMAIRTILSAAGLWYQDDLHRKLDTDGAVGFVEGIHQEYVLERDPEEADGQSPNDLSCDDQEIVDSIARKFAVLTLEPSRSFIYRVMGGLRGDQNRLNEIATVLAKIDSGLVGAGILNPNYQYGVGRKLGSL